MYWVTCRLAMRHARLSRTTCTAPVLAATAAARQASWERSDAGRGACRTSCPGWDGTKAPGGEGFNQEILHINHINHVCIYIYKYIL